MPIFEFSCECGERAEEIQGANEEHALTCKCGKPMRRLFSAGQKIKIDFTPGLDVQAGKVFTTKRERDNFLAEKNWERIRS